MALSEAACVSVISIANLRDMAREVKEARSNFLELAMTDPAKCMSDLGSIADRLMMLRELPGCCGESEKEAAALLFSVSQMLQQLEHQLDPNPVW